MNICRLTQGKNLRGVACPLYRSGPCDRQALSPASPPHREEGGLTASQALGSTPDHRPLLQASHPPQEDRPLHPELADQQRPQEGQCAAQDHTGGGRRDSTSGRSGPKTRAFSPEASRVNHEHPDQGQRSPQVTRGGLWPACALSGPHTVSVNQLPTIRSLEILQ